jgi:hypothetical protein
VRSIVIETIGDVIEHPGLRLHADCCRCGRSTAIDLKSLAHKFGPGFSLERLRKRLRCNRCGAWDATIRFVHDGTPMSVPPER